MTRLEEFTVVKRFQVYVVYFFYLLILAVNAAAQTVPLWDRCEQIFIPGFPLHAKLNLTLNSPPRPAGSSLLQASGTGVRHGARFMPVEVGTWLYRTHSVSVLDGLDGKGGTFVVVRREEILAFCSTGRCASQPMVVFSNMPNLFLLDGRHSLVRCDFEFQS